MKSKLGRAAQWKLLLPRAYTQSKGATHEKLCSFRSGIVVWYIWYFASSQWEEHLRRAEVAGDFSIGAVRCTDIERL
jgi:hypothetical protein